MKRCWCSFSPFGRKAFYLKQQTRQFKPKLKVAKISFLSLFHKKTDTPYGLPGFFCLRMEKFEIMRRFAKQTARAWRTSAAGGGLRERDKGENKEYAKRAPSSACWRLCFRVGRRNATHFDTFSLSISSKEKALNRKMWGLFLFFLTFSLRSIYSWPLFWPLSGEHGNSS